MFSLCPHPRRLAAFIAILLWSINSLHAYDPVFDFDEGQKRLVRLDGEWKFSVGDGAERAEVNFDDSDWSTIHAPESWQSEGYRGYHGFAWYRKAFRLRSVSAQDNLTLYLGRIDDVDEVFVNGHRVGGMGQFPPHYKTAYDNRRNYPVPMEYLHQGASNVIAVRVYDGGGVGGIVRGKIGLYTRVGIRSEIALDGAWKFSPGDNSDWKNPDADESSFRQISVPLVWENAGYPELDGYAWYRKTFTVTTKPEAQTLVLLLGKIDDFDEVFLNGVSIGRTGDIDQPEHSEDERSYALNRVYYFPASLLKEKNTIAVRVYDTHNFGGIYAGPIGIVTQAKFVEYWEERRHHPLRNFFRHVEWNGHGFQIDD